MASSCKVLVGCLVAGAGLAFAPAVRGQVFSLDDNSFFPATTPLPAPAALPFPPFGFGAEDPFGKLMPAPGLAPSPSLALPGPAKIDGTILSTGPAVHLAIPFDAASLLLHNYIDALSNNTIPSQPGKLITVLFSIDRKSSGVAGSHSAVEAGFNQQPADIYYSTSMFRSPGELPPALPPGVGYSPVRLTPPKPGSNRLLYNQDFIGLTAGLPPGPGSAIPPFTPAPPIGPGTHDNIDAFELRALDTTGDLIADVNYFFSISPVDAVDLRYATFLPHDSADVWIDPAGPAGSAVYAPAAALGLAPILPAFPLPPVMGNDIDALVVWDIGNDGIATPGTDFALFSLAPGSIALAAFGNSAADVFFTDFSGSYAIYASAADLGLLPTDNVDALEIMLSGDANVNGSVNLADLVALASNYNVSYPPLTKDWWFKGDFDGNGEAGLSDLVVWAAANGGMSGGAGSGADAPSAGVPEPVGLVLAALAIVGATCGCRRRKLLQRPAVSLIVRCGGTLIVVASWSSAVQAASVSVTTVPIAGGLFQHLLSVTALPFEGDVLGFEIAVQGPGINQVNPAGLLTVFADDALALYPLVGATPAQDTHVLYNSTDGFSIPGFSVDTLSLYRVATGVPPATPLVPVGPPRNLFQLVTVGNLALTATRLRINVGGAGGDQVFDGFVLNGHWQFGDYNLNGIVDGADYVAWRNFGGTPAQYNTWRSHFGQIAPGSGSAVSVNAAVPESTSVLMLLVGVLAIYSRRREVVS